MAVPKRKMSRSNTRARRSQWKTTAPTLVRCPNRACGEMSCRTRRVRTAASTPASRFSPSERPTATWFRSTRAGRPAGAGRRARRRTGRRAAAPRADASLLRLRARRPAAQRAAGVPRRRRSRHRRHRHAVPGASRPHRGQAGQAAGLGGQHAGAGRHRPRHRTRRPRRVRPPRSRRGGHGRSRQGQHPRRHPRSGASARSTSITVWTAPAG